jgi:hypothetical protein
MIVAVNDGLTSSTMYSFLRILWLAQIKEHYVKVSDITIFNFTTPLSVIIATINLPF